MKQKEGEKQEVVVGELNDAQQSIGSNNVLKDQTYKTDMLPCSIKGKLLFYSHNQKDQKLIDS